MAVWSYDRGHPDPGARWAEHQPERQPRHRLRDNRYAHLATPADVAAAMNADLAVIVRDAAARIQQLTPEPPTP